jgi:hypothetical protein
MSNPAKPAKQSVAETAYGTVRMSGRASCDCGRRFQAPDVEVGPDFIRIVCPGCHHDILDIRS